MPLGFLPAGHVSAATGPDDSAVNQSLKSFTQIYDVVEQNFADPVKADKAIYKGAIPGMLRTLDPHSNFFDPKDYAALRADQRDHYFGIGMTVAQHGTKDVVMRSVRGIARLQGGPAAGRRDRRGQR